MAPHAAVNVPRPVAVRRNRRGGPQNVGRVRRNGIARRVKRNLAHSELLPPPPKRASAGYIFFMRSLTNDQMAGQRMSGQEVLRVTGAQWRLLPAARKAEFNRQAVADQERYQREIVAWKARKAELKRPGAPYCQFVKAVWAREGARDRTLAQVGRHCAEMWRDMKPQEKKVYEDRHAQLQQAYNQRIQVLLAEHQNAAAAADAADEQEDDEEADDEEEEDEEEDDEEEYDEDEEEDVDEEEDDSEDDE